MTPIDPSFVHYTPEYQKFLEKQSEESNMDDYARSISTQEGFHTGPTLASINDWGKVPSTLGKVPSANMQEPVLRFADEQITPTNPVHYQNSDPLYEHRFVAKAWDLEYYLSAATKYIARCGKKSSVGMSDVDKEIQDLEKSIVYIQFRIDELKGE